MAIEMRIIHLCDHLETKVTSVLFPDRPVTRSSALDYDILNKTARVREIYEVVSRDTELNEWIVYEQDKDFVLFTTNKIKWISGGESPQAGEEYLVTYSVNVPETKEYVQDDCPRCVGYGWYSKLSSDISMNVEDAEGLGKLAQNIIKIILTERTSGYGSRIHTLLEGNINNEQAIMSSVRAMIFEVEEDYKAFQLESEENGVLISSLDKLERIVVNDIFVDNNGLGINVNIVIFNENNNYVEIWV